MLRLVNRSSLHPVFDITDDVRPPRTKTFHPFGIEPDAGHPFTGIFASGAVGLGRLSLTRGASQYAPSAAFKFLFDGPYPSENLLLDQSIESQSSRDFFERAPTNYTVWPTRYPLKILWKVVVWWLSALGNPMFRPLDHLAERTSDGQPVGKVVAPQLVFLYGVDERHTDPRSTVDFRHELAAIEPESDLYYLFGTPTGSSERFLIGTIRSESAFVASEFGDRILSLRHSVSERETAPPQ
jgi:hypothetical protein